ncbi:MAG: D-alanine--D-alanine ligase [Akkermansiaceae bacterium]|jgi:D-alanine-D-alanine ligase|nr:D-alanine--D-alanine ligase [Akkermansiaceae bacterium]MDP4647634.1 D-alanine--D-alanine ligase [Akkermansiaceae bacterium]MDP4722308.1 D-alanine--D-alanine ligase [Akkermansiaceae bacterium]MDP4780348.1 D-alanine--D-alanine ligase [Akkermansiaceae bacterium]MDP4846169.1 D-alanine--D-alanine ligase [Akkermansiaceae bacterium]
MLSQIKIAVLMGGPGSERQVSLASGNAVLNALLSLGLDAIAVDVTSTTIDLPEGTGLCFNLIHGTFGEDGQLQSILDGMGIPYTGARAESSRIAFDKGLAKEAFIAANVPTPKSEIIDCTNGPVMPSFPPPFVVKPPREGSSVGIEIVKTQEEAEAAITKAAKLSNDLLIEEFISGAELTVPVIDGEAYPIVHIIPPEGVYDMATKYPWLSGKATGSQYICPADLDLETTMSVQAAAVAAHKSLNLEVYSRVDVMLDADNNPYVLEANTIPGMTETSLLPKSAAAGGLPFPELCKRIAELSLNV